MLTNIEFAQEKLTLYQKIKWIFRTQIYSLGDLNFKYEGNQLQ